MAKGATVRARLKPKLGRATQVRMPNKETARALKEIRARKNTETFDSVSTWVKKVRAL